MGLLDGVSWGSPSQSPLLTFQQLVIKATTSGRRGASFYRAMEWPPGIRVGSTEVPFRQLHGHRLSPPLSEEACCSHSGRSQVAGFAQSSGEDACFTPGPSITSPTSGDLAQCPHQRLHPHVPVGGLGRERGLPTMLPLWGVAAETSVPAWGLPVDPVQLP